jgi:hypothetical protein
LKTGDPDSKKVGASGGRISPIIYILVHIKYYLYNKICILQVEEN